MNKASRGHCFSPSSSAQCTHHSSPTWPSPHCRLSLGFSLYCSRLRSHQFNFQSLFLHPCKNNPATWNLTTAWYRWESDARRGELACSRLHVPGGPELPCNPGLLDGWVTFLLSCPERQRHLRAGLSALKREPCSWPGKPGYLWAADVRTPGVSRPGLRQSSIRGLFSFQKSKFTTGLGRAFLRESPITGAPHSKCKNAWFVLF